MTKYIKNKSGKIIALVWDEPKTYGNALVAGIVLLAIAATGIAYWKTRGES